MIRSYSDVRSRASGDQMEVVLVSSYSLVRGRGPCTDWMEGVPIGSYSVVQGRGTRMETIEG